MCNEEVRADEEWLEATKKAGTSSVRMFTSESYYRSFWELAEHAIIIVDNNKNIIEVNPAFVELVGISAADLEGRSISEFVNPHNWNIDNINMNALIRGKYYSYSAEKEIIHRDNMDTNMVPVHIIITRVPSTLTRQFQHFIIQIYKIKEATQDSRQPLINQTNQTFANIFKNLLLQPWFVKTALWFLSILVIMLTLSGNLMPIIERFFN